MPRPAQPTPRELEVLAVLWELGEATVREVYRRMNAGQDKLAQNTVQTFLRDMEEKGLVAHRTQGRAFVYRPLYSREQSLVRFLDTVFQGAADQLFVSLLKARRMKKREIEAIVAMIQEAREKESR